MPSFVYNSAVDDMAGGAIDFDTDAFKMLLVTSGYVPSKDNHDRRDDVTNEVANGNGYTTGGIAVTCTKVKDVTTDRVTLTFGAGSWPSSTISSTGAVVYKFRNGASSADELVFYNDFNGTITSTNGLFSVGSSTITLQN